MCDGSVHDWFVWINKTLLRLMAWGTKTQGHVTLSTQRKTASQTLPSKHEASNAMCTFPKPPIVCWEPWLREDLSSPIFRKYFPDQSIKPILQRKTRDSYPTKKKSTFKSPPDMAEDMDTWGPHASVLLYEAQTLKIDSSAPTRISSVPADRGANFMVFINFSRSSGQF